MGVKNKEDLKLIFIRIIGSNYKGEDIYEFMFSDNYEDAVGVNWEKIQFDGANPPEDEYINEVGTVITNKIELSLLSENENFRYLDGVFDIMPLAYEYIDDYSLHSSLNIELLKFRFGETKESVTKKLFSKEINIKFE